MKTLPRDCARKNLSILNKATYSSVVFLKATTQPAVLVCQLYMAVQTQVRMGMYWLRKESPVPLYANVLTCLRGGILVNLE